MLGSHRQRGDEDRDRPGALRQRTALGVHQHGDIVVVLAHDRREGGPSQRAVGLVGDEDQPVPENLQGDGIVEIDLWASHGRAPHLMCMMRLPRASTWAVPRGPTTMVDSTCSTITGPFISTSCGRA